MASTNLVCIVDDQVDYCFLIQRLFTLYFPIYPVQFFEGGQALLNTLPHLKPRPSLILLDRHMPQLDGHQTLLRLKEHPTYQTIPVVMMSAEATAVEIQGCYEAGANSFLIKKLDLASLKEQIKTVCHYWLETNQTTIEV